MMTCQTESSMVRLHGRHVYLVAAYYCEGPLDKKEGGNLPGGVPYALRVGEGTPVQKGWAAGGVGGGHRQKMASRRVATVAMASGLRRRGGD